MRHNEEQVARRVPLRDPIAVRVDLNQHRVLQREFINGHGGSAERR
jgi:hypothetical protein